MARTLVCDSSNSPRPSVNTFNHKSQPKVLQFQIPVPQRNHRIKQVDTMFIFTWLALALISSTSASSPVLGLHNLCTLPRFFEQYHNSTCTVSYFLEQNLNVAELWAFDCNCTQVAHAYPVPIGSSYNFQTNFTFQPRYEHSSLKSQHCLLIKPPRSHPLPFSD